MSLQYPNSTSASGFRPGKNYVISQRPSDLLYATAHSATDRSRLYDNDSEDSYVLDRDYQHDQPILTTDATSEEEDTPFSEPTDIDLDINGRARRRYAIDPTHPATDAATDIDTTELYNDGLTGAIDASEPNAGSAVLGYEPTSDTRNLH